MAVAVTERPPTPPAGPPHGGPPPSGVVSRLSTLDRFLPLWIALAIAGGLALGSLLPHLNDWLAKLQVGTVSLPIAAGLLLMMYPVLAKVRYEELGHAHADGVSDPRPRTRVLRDRPRPQTSVRDLM